MRGHVEQLSVTTNQGPTLCFQSREMKGNKQIKLEPPPRPLLQQFSKRGVIIAKKNTINYQANEEKLHIYFKEFW